MSEMSEMLLARICVLEGRVDAAHDLIVKVLIEREVEKQRATIEEERSNPCQCSHSSSPSASATSSFSDRAAIEFGEARARQAREEKRADLIEGVRAGFTGLSQNFGGMWLSREEILALLGEPT